ncbi:hypothetical protein HFO15_19710 [Rhizobium laguerreae]|uniref:phospholipase D-like domain-containing protein n=1 Tax=Rhizobium laguerreae TaxID=1076926 RepID=UPI001C9145A2|nr:phospholipase D-like domain-containing protein [Rhizobium laguerreae]MBY3263855.1 hypothetical protein [Rhizobium laguerreae]
MQPSLLNSTIDMDGSYGSLESIDNGATSGAVEVVFRDIESRIVREIAKADTVLGCVAWLTSLPILDALSRKWQVSIVVQKEDFLRPDSGRWQLQRQREAYAKLPSYYRLGNPRTHNYSFATDPVDDAIRCAGMWAANSIYPRMHNKFLVLCRCATPPRPDDIGPNPYTPYAVITGSFNMSHNATNSLENIIIINDEKIAGAYAGEHATIYGISEPLDWEKPVVAPEYRIGT